MEERAPSDRIDSRRMLAELDFPTGLRIEILDAYGVAADELAKFIEGHAGDRTPRTATRCSRSSTCSPAASPT